MDTRGAGQGMKSYVAVILLILGIAAGIAATLYGPGALKPYLPKGLVKDTAKTVDATVIDKRKEDGVLLLTVDSEQGAMLITFNAKVSEIDLLVKKGYIITIGLKKYEPFITNPAIKKVRRVPVEAEDVEIEKKVAEELKHDGGAGGSANPDDKAAAPAPATNTPAK